MRSETRAAPESIPAAPLLDHLGWVGRELRVRKLKLSGALGSRACNAFAFFVGENRHGAFKVFFSNGALKVKSPIKAGSKQSEN